MATEMTSPTSTRAPETAALVATLRDVGSDALTSCPGWSARHIAAPDRDPRLELAGPAGPAAVEADGAARLLLLWGRKPQPFHRLRATGDPATVARLQLLLAGY